MKTIKELSTESLGLQITDFWRILIKKEGDIIKELSFGWDSGLNLQDRAIALSILYPEHIIHVEAAGLPRMSAFNGFVAKGWGFQFPGGPKYEGNPSIVKLFDDMEPASRVRNETKDRIYNGFINHLGEEV